MAVVAAMGKYTPVKTDYAIRSEVRVTERLTSHIVVGTPGTMVDYIKRRIIDPTPIKVLVLDEADNMLDQENLSEQCLKIKKYSLCSFYIPGRHSSRIPCPDQLSSERSSATDCPILRNIP